MNSFKFHLVLLKLIFLCITTTISSQLIADPSSTVEVTEVDIGEKLFLDDRFSYGFYSQNEFSVNTTAPVEEPALIELITNTGVYLHPQKGEQFSCSSCHLVDQASSIRESFVFTYNDFTPRTPIRDRGDSLHKTTRNSMNLVLQAGEQDIPLHWDGEFFSVKELSCTSLTGRNMGWLPHEAAEAQEHILNVLRQDNGTYNTASDFTDSYSQLFLEIGHDIKKLNDSSLMDLSCQAIASYIKDISFSTDENGFYNASAYDRFLQINNIRRAPKNNETHLQYIKYLKKQVNKEMLLYPKTKPLKFHNHPSKFSQTELSGLKIFLGKAQCASCHTPPQFTDFMLHNIGISQFEYDKTHGNGAFSKLDIPSLVDRNKDKENYFFATNKNPRWKGLFRSIPQKNNPMHVDLGAWNLLGHPDKGHIQNQLMKALCSQPDGSPCHLTKDAYLQKAIASFKTPTLRNLGQSGPYFHNGQSKNIHEVLTTYIKVSRMARKKLIRNADTELKDINIHPSDFQSLKSFLNSLNEDYD